MRLLLHYLLYLGLLPRYAASWIDQRERQTERAHLTILFEKYVPLCLEKMKNTFKTITPIPEISMVQVRTTQAHTVYFFLLCKSLELEDCNMTIIIFLLIQTLCILLDCLLTPENIPSESPREIYETYFTFACIWAFGGGICQDQVFV